MYITLRVLYNDVCNTECGLQLWNKVETYLLTYIKFRIISCIRSWIHAMDSWKVGDENNAPLI